MRTAIACLLIAVLGLAAFQRADAAGETKAEKKARKAAKQDAIADLEARIAAASTDKERASLRFKLAQEYEKAKRYDDAVKATVQAGKDDPNMSSSALARLASAVKRHNEIDAALIIDSHLTLIGLLADSGTRYTWSHSLYQTFRQRKQEWTLDKHLRARLTKDPKDGCAAVVLGYCLYHGRKWKDAAKYLSMGRTAYPDDQSVMRYLAFSYNYERDYANALTAFLDVAKAFPTTTSYHYYIANCYANLGREAEAQKWVDDEIKAVPDGDPTRRANALRHAALVCTTLKQFDKAADISREAYHLLAKSGTSRSTDVYFYYYLTSLQQADLREELLAQCKVLLDSPEYANSRYRRYATRYLRNLYRTYLGTDAAVKMLDKELDDLPPTAANAPARTWRLEELAELYTGAAQYRKALAVYAEMQGTDEKTRKSIQTKVEALESILARMESETAAMLDSDGALWRKIDPFDEQRTWVAFKDRLIVVDRENGQHRIYKSFFGYDHWRANTILFLPATVWLATDRGLFAYSRDLRSWQRYPVDAERIEANVVDVAVAKDGDLDLTVRTKDIDEPVTLILPPADME